ncbi:hypothetical protein KKF82_05765 [Patescibacteria group bacterium]|nr:hypothetical protein [Patescibacteria group bacterium]
MTTINGRLGLTGTVIIEGTELRWDITAPTPANFTYGSSAMIPLVGDWDGDGIEGIGAYEPSTGTFFLKQTATGGNADISIQYGFLGVTPISWYDESAIPKYDGVGIIYGSAVFLDTYLSSGDAEIYTTTDYVSCSTPIIRQCIYISPTYLTCVSGICKRVDGYGTDTCIEGTSCAYIPPPAYIPPSGNMLIYAAVAAGLVIIYMSKRKKLSTRNK